MAIDVVIKIGSMALINEARDDIDYNIIKRISGELRPGMILVTSGATEIGRLDYIKRCGAELKGGTDEDNKADYAAQGQSILMQNYRLYINSKYNVRQVLVEHQHFNTPEKLKNLKRMFLRAPGQNAIPIVNYNDAVCYEENRRMEIQLLKAQSVKVIQGVDNDETAAEICCLVGAKTLILLTSVDGIYMTAEDPRTIIGSIRADSAAALITKVDEIKKSCVGSSRKGAAGAAAKLEYIKEPLKCGTTVIIANSKYSVQDILNGSCPRTIIGLNIK